MRLIRSISAEEHNQQILEAKRTFDAGLDAFAARDIKDERFDDFVAALTASGPLVPVRKDVPR